MAIIAAFAAACDGGELRPERIPGTERIEPGDNSPWFTISPDEQWLAFMEIDSGYSASSAPRRFHLATLDLASLVKTDHHVRDVPGGTFPPPARNDPWQEVQMDFGVSSWLDGRLFVQIRWNPPGSPWIAFKPGAAPAELVNAPGELRCSDCAPPDEWRRLMDSYQLPASYDGDVSIAYRDERFSEVMYRAEHRRYDDVAIERIERGGKPELVIQHKSHFRNMYIGYLRVSPNERYLAYELISDLKSPVPLPSTRHELHILDLVAGEKLHVPGDYRVMGNLIWSPDSKRLYYAAVDGPVADGQGDGVFKIDLSREAK